MIYVIDGEEHPKRKLITIDGSKVTTETGIPLARNIVLPGVQSDGSDVRIALLNGTPIAREIECVGVPSTDAVMFHYPFDTVAGENSQFYVYWGNASLSEPAADSTYGSEAVWDSNHGLVLHMNNDPASSDLLDSTSNGYDGTKVGTPTISDSPDGKKITFGDNNYYNFGNVLDFGDNGITVIAKTYITDISYANRLLYKRAGAAATEDGYGIGKIATSGYAVNWYDTVTETSTIPNQDEWEIVGYTGQGSEGTAVKIFLDGIAIKTSTATSDTQSNSSSLLLGKHTTLASYFQGSMAEIRIIIGAKSENYMLTTSNNLNNPTASGTDPFYLNRYDDSQVYYAKSDSSGTESSFLRRTEIIRNHTGALTDHQQRYTTPHHNLMNLDFSDLRFNTQADGSGAYLDYWIESQTDGDTADIWVESDYASGDDIVYMFYGNSSLVSESSGADTFIQWHGAATANYIDSLNVSPSNIIYETKIKRTASTHDIQFGLFNTQTQTDDYFSLLTYDAANSVYVKSGNEGVQTAISETPQLAINTYYRGKMTFDGTTLYGFFDDNEISSGGVATNIANESLGLALWIVNGTCIQDWSFVRKYTATEPTYTIGITTAPDKFSAVSDSDGNVSVFERRKPILMSGLSETSDFEETVTVLYEQGMLDNFDDIRFITSDGIHIPYEIISKTDGVTASVNIVFDAVTGDNTITMYYDESNLDEGSDSSLTWGTPDTSAVVGAEQHPKTGDMMIL